MLPTLSPVDRSAALAWEPPDKWRRIRVVDSHTGGEPFRVIVDGFPALSGSTMLERRQEALEQHDMLRRALMWEPRGHADMYGGLIGPPLSAEADLSVLFMHNEGFSTMCGHGIIALATVAIETGLVPATGPITELGIETPAGLIRARAVVEEGRVGEVRFVNVSSFAPELDARVEVPGYGEIRYDLGFGGAFYAFVDAGSLGLACVSEEVDALIAAGRAIKAAVAASREITHPLEPGLGFLYGVIFVGPATTPGHHSRNVCVFADGEVDRSPTGTGVSARLAIHHARGELESGEEIVVESIIGSTFTGRIARLAEVGGVAAVVPEIGGRAHVTGRGELWLDPEDGLGAGFLVR